MTKRIDCFPGNAPLGKLIDDVVVEVLKRAKDGCPDNFFDHLMVIVPTAESGRNLRLALAEAFPGRGVIPPHVVQPTHLIKPADARIQKASDVELQSAFLAFIQNPANRVEQWETLFQNEFLHKKDTRAFLGFLDQLNEIWHALSGQGLLMQDVLTVPTARQVLEQAQGLEPERWAQLGQFEKAFFTYLEGQGLYPHALYVKKALDDLAPLPAGIEEVILPALVDPIRVLPRALESLQAKQGFQISVLIHAADSEKDKFDAWGRPLPAAWGREVLAGLRTEDIFRAATNQALGEQVAQAFAQLKPHALPALGLTDAGTFSDIQASLMNQGFEVHNPERHSLAVSSLGALVDLLTSVWAARAALATVPWQIWVGLLRAHDVMKFVTAHDATLTREKILAEADAFGNKFLPVTRPTAAQLAYRDAHLGFAHLAAALARVETLFDATCDLPQFIRVALQKIYQTAPAHKEFQAAAQTTREMLQQLDCAPFKALSADDQVLIARQALAQANYQLEPENPNVIKTLGWLELAWTPKQQVALAGFHEGCVPDALIGHAFLPDSLRVALGLTSNEQRLARDVYLLNDILAARAANDVKVFVALANAGGEIQKPSRLLFLCEDAELPGRVRHLFDELPDEATRRETPATLSYRLTKADVAAEVQRHFKGRLSPSAIDTYIKCPFTYLLQKGLYLKGYRREEELPANEFGTLAHAILQDYTLRQIQRTKNKQEQLLREDLIRRELLDCFASCVALYGTSHTANLALQLEALKSRILAFAPIQAHWAADGWVAYAAEYDVLDEAAFEVDGAQIALKGFIDRVDRNTRTGQFRIIDYKTWDTHESLEQKVFAGSAEETAFAEKMGFWRGKLSNRQRSPRRFLTVQLPLYARAFARLEQCEVAEMCYLLLGSSPSEVGVRLGIGDSFCNLMDVQEAALATAQRAVEGIVRQDFWHFGPGELWKYEFGRYFGGMNVKDWEVPS